MWILTHRCWLFQSTAPQIKGLLVLIRDLFGIWSFVVGFLKLWETEYQGNSTVSHLLLLFSSWWNRGLRNGGCLLHISPTHTEDALDFTVSVPDSICPSPSLRGVEAPRSHGPQHWCLWSPCQSQLGTQAEPAGQDVQVGMWARLPSWGAAWSPFGSWFHKQTGWGCRKQRCTLTGSYLASLWVPTMQTFGGSL